LFNQRYFMMKSFKYILLTVVMIIFVGKIALSQTQKDVVCGNLIQFYNNGLWRWYQDERAVIDFVNGKIILGSAASGAGVDSISRNGADDAKIFDLQTRSLKRYMRNQWTGNCYNHSMAGQRNLT